MSRADPDRQRQGLHRPVQPATGRGALRPDLSGERHRAPVDPAPVAHHDREDRAVPPGDAHRVPHRPGLQQPRPAPRPSSTSGSPTTTPTGPTRRWTWPPRPRGSSTPSPLPVTTAARCPPALRPDEDRTDGTWVTRRASAVGVVCVNWQQVCLGVAAAGRPRRRLGHRGGPAVLRRRPLLRTEKRTSTGEVRVKRSQAPQRRPKVQTSVTDQPK